jgi:hypothetical protein
VRRGLSSVELATVCGVRVADLSHHALVMNAILDHKIDMLDSFDVFGLGLKQF